VKGGRISGNPNSIARILHHQAVEANPRYRPDAEQESYLYDTPHIIQPYQPVKAGAKDLPHPTLNVMWGPVAPHGALQYGVGMKDPVLVEMRLGDLHTAHGGQAFFDGTLSEDARSIPLIVTLPKGQTVPVRIVDPESLAAPSSDED